MARFEKRWVALAIVLGVVAAAGVGFWLWTTRQTGNGEVELRPMTRDELQTRLGEDASSVTRLIDLLAFNDTVKQAVGKLDGQDSPAAHAEAVGRLIRSRVTPVSLLEPEARALILAPEAWARRDKVSLYPLEAAAMAVAALRSLDVPAMVAEVYSLPGKKQPPDPTGHLGYYVIAVYPDEPGVGAPQLVDAFTGQKLAIAENDSRVLTDAQVIAAGAGIEALRSILREGDAQKAVTLSSVATRLDPRSPSAHEVRGAVLLASGGLTEGMAEHESAVQIRADAPRRANLAAVLLMQGDVERATREIGLALQEAPDFAQAHATLGAIHLGKGELDKARSEFEQAERLLPQLPNLHWMWANYHAAAGEIPAAIARAQQGIEARPKDFQGRLLLATLLARAGRDSEVKAQIQAALELAPESRRAELQARIQQMFGDAALAGGPAPDDLVLPDVPSDLTLGAQPAEPQQGGETGSNLRLGDPSRFRLSEPSSGFKLKLGE